MSAPSILNLVSIIETVATSHPAVRSFGTGENHAISLAGNSKPVHVWLEQPFRRITKNQPGRNKTRRYQLAIMVLDLPMRDQSDALALISNCDLIADWIALRLQENPPTVLRVDGDWDILSFTEYGADNWSGVRMEIFIETPLPMGACDVRFYNV